MEAVLSTLWKGRFKPKGMERARELCVKIHKKQCQKSAKKVDICQYLC